jgi:hypothetical protein
VALHRRDADVAVAERDEQPNTRGAALTLWPKHAAQASSAAATRSGGTPPWVATATRTHAGLRLVDRRRQALRWIHDAGGTDLTLDDLDLVAELLLAACARS